MKKGNFKEKIPDMKTVFGIFKNDLKEIKSNKILLIVLVGLMIIPSLYAWFNIKAFWDPYGNTKFLKVAIVNLDEGTDFKGQRMDLGSKVVENLKEKPVLDWQFVSPSNAKKGLDSGEYYAIIELPPEFSKDILSFTEKDVRKAKINYTVNEKTNAIAPKITDKGANTIQQNISQSLIETISNVTIGTLGGVSNTLGDINPKLDSMKASLNRLDKQLDNAKNIANVGGRSISDVQRILDDNKNNLPRIKRTLEDTKDNLRDINSSLNVINNSFKDLSPSIKQDIENVTGLIGQSSDLSKELANNINNVGDDTIVILNKIHSKNLTAINILGSVIKVLNKINVLNSAIINIPLNSLNEYLSLITDMDRLVLDSISLIESGGRLSQDTVSKLSSYGDLLSRKAVTILSDFDENIKEPLNRISNNGSNISESISKLVSDNSGIYYNIDSLLNNAASINTGFKSVTSVTSNSIDLMKAQIRDSIDNIEKLQNNKEFKEFSEVIKSNIANRVDFLKEPIEINEKKIYKIENYGSAMTPFYSILAAWVGCLILISVLSTSTKGDYRAIDEYFGRMLLFMSMALVQSLIISLGNFFILGVTAKHPVMFTLLMLYCSMVFVTIVYSMVSIFGTVGKGIGIFLLVIQIGGSGGTFPVQMTPTFFRAINSIIPFTYGIEACREAIGGIYWPNLYKDLIALFIFMVITILFSAMFKGKINKAGEPLKHMFNDSSLIGH